MVCKECEEGNVSFLVCIGNYCYCYNCRYVDVVEVNFGLQISFVFVLLLGEIEKLFFFCFVEFKCIIIGDEVNQIRFFVGWKSLMVRLVEIVKEIEEKQ